MAAPGRPTPQPPSDERPRFQDRLPEEHRRPEVNPYVRSHREFGPELLPASEAWKWRGRWHERFGRKAPLHVEIGAGNGFFLAGMAERHPEWDFLGVEIRYKRCLQTGLKLRRAGLTNAAVLRYHAAYLDDLFEPGSVSAIYVNHPDPWPKEKHEKNRLISRWFLEDCAMLLPPGGVVRLKSDFRPNVDRIEELLAEHPLPFRVTGRSEDVNSGPAPWPDDVETNYQRKMKVRGVPVPAIEIVRT